MAFGLGKLAAVSGVTAAGGGIGVSMGNIVFSESKDTSIKTKKEESPSPTQSTVETQPKVCVIYEGNDPGRDKNTRRFSELLERFEGKEKFFEKYKEGAQKSASQDFKEEIRKACEGTDGKKNVKGNVYVWWGTSENKWFYASDMHDETDDWENDSQVQKKFQTETTPKQA
ncbi:hypothetical protein MHF_1153 [Mycoplasma haemofelis Ohio2]|uniref:Uncharacterized protein n=1 Tax=Mycoplasma haemofelis (strain Ohio2) TaxID=859194 RepID=F6FJP0_MYCHI|nr:hypothetical protein MHF_1153 [Mycoplasma haemofelis Ohio2]